MIGESQKLREELAADDDRMGEMARQVAEQEKVIEELDRLLNLLQRHEEDGGLDCVRMLHGTDTCEVCPSCQLRAALNRAEQYRKQKGGNRG